MDLLAQQRDVSDILVPVAMVLLIIVAMVGGIAIVRRKMMSGQSDENDPLAGFSLSSMRQLVREGKMTQAEYDAAKQQIIAAAQRAAAKKNPAKDPIEHKLPTEAGLDDPSDDEGDLSSSR